MNLYFEVLNQACFQVNEISCKAEEFGLLLLGVAAYVLSFNLFKVGNLREFAILVIFPNCDCYVIVYCTKYVDPG